MQDDLARVKNSYADVQSVLNQANSDIGSVGIGDEDAMGEIDKVKESLTALTGKLQTEINSLEKNSEWDKLCIAFFGETNAGKSTIIDALRILYDEDSRHAKLLQGKEKVGLAYSDNSKSLLDAVQKMHDIEETFNKGVQDFRSVKQREAEAKERIAKEETEAKDRIANEEAESKHKLAEQERELNERIGKREGEVSVREEDISKREGAIKEREDTITQRETNYNNGRTVRIIRQIVIAVAAAAAAFGLSFVL